MFQTKCILICAFILLTQTVAKGDDFSGIAYISSLEGHATVKHLDHSEGKKTKLHDSILFEQATVFDTAYESTLFFKLSNNTSIGILENSRLTIKEFSQEPFESNPISNQSEPSSSNLWGILDYGSIALKTTKQSPLSSFIIEFPNIKLEFYSADCLISYDHDILKIALYKGNIHAKFINTAKSFYLRDSCYYETNVISMDLEIVESIKPLDQANAKWSEYIEFLNYDHNRVYFKPLSTKDTSIAKGMILIPDTYFKKPFESPKTFD